MVYNLFLRGMEDSQIIRKSSLKHKQQLKFHDVSQKQVIKSTLINASALFKNQLLPIVQTDVAKETNELHSNHQKQLLSSGANSSDD